MMKTKKTETKTKAEAYGVWYFKTEKEENNILKKKAVKTHLKCGYLLYIAISVLSHGTFCFCISTIQL